MNDIDREAHHSRQLAALKRHLRGNRLLDRCLSDWSPADGLVWYPSSGTDYRDLLELTPSRRQLHDLRRAPHLFVHTDVPVSRGFHPGRVLFDDGRTQVHMLEREVIEASSHLMSTVGLGDANFAPNGDMFRGWLMRVQARSEDVEVSESWLLRLECRNYDFFVRMVLQAGLRIDTYVQVRQGLGMGGCDLGTTYLLPWLAGAGVGELLCDGEFHGWRERFEEVAEVLLREGAPTTVRRVEVEHRRQPVIWSEYGVDAARVRSLGHASSLEEAWLHCQRAYTHPASRWAERP